MKSIQSSQLTKLFPQNHGNTENLEKVNGSLERNTRKFKEQSVTKLIWSGGGWRVLHPGFCRNWRVTKKLSQEFSRTESRVLGALSKLDEFLLNPQVGTGSVAVPGTPRNNNSQNLKPTGDRSLDDPSPEVVFSAFHTSNLNDSEQEETHHSHQLSIIVPFRLKVFWITGPTKLHRKHGCQEIGKGVTLGNHDTFDAKVVTLKTAVTRLTKERKCHLNAMLWTLVMFNLESCWELYAAQLTWVDWTDHCVCCHTRRHVHNFLLSAIFSR